MTVQLRLKQNNGTSLILDKACLPLAQNWLLLSIKEGVLLTQLQTLSQWWDCPDVGTMQHEEKKKGNCGLTLMLHEYHWRNEGLSQSCTWRKKEEENIEKKKASMLYPCSSQTNFTSWLEKPGFVTACGCREITALESGQRCGDESLSALLPGWFEGNIH